MNHNDEITALLSENMGKEVSQSADNSERASRSFASPPWEFLEGSDEGNTIISMALASDPGKPWWTAIIICADLDVQNRVGRLMVSAPDLLAALKHCLVEHGGFTIKGECERQARAAIAKAEEETP